VPREITRLHLASLQGVDGRRWPVHGFVVTHPGAEVLPGLEVIATPGHTAGHQCVLVRGHGDHGDHGDGGDGALDVLIGDAAYTPRVYADPASDRLPNGQASDVPAWRDSVQRIKTLGPERVHFCHHTDVVHR
jgi:N-acyl homoserine lactone hydrolase